MPRTSRSRDLEDDGECVYFAYTNSVMSEFPLGSQAWRMWCNQQWTDVALTISYQEERDPIGVVDCENEIKHCGGIGQVECVIETTASRTDTSEWSVCASASFGFLTAEASSEVCGSGSRESSTETHTTDTITAPMNTTIVACQRGKFVRVDGKTFVRMISGLIT